MILPLKMMLFGQKGDYREYFADGGGVGTEDSGEEEAGQEADGDGEEEEEEEVLDIDGLIASFRDDDDTIGTSNDVVEFLQKGLRKTQMFDIWSAFQWKNPDFLLKIPDFRLKNVDFIIQTGARSGSNSRKRSVFNERILISY